MLVTFGKMVRKGTEFVKLFCDLFLNTADTSDNLGKRVILAEVDWDVGTRAAQIVNQSFAAVAGSMFVPQTIQVSAISLHVYV